MEIARVQTRGQVTIPQEIREACGVAPGTELLFMVLGPGRFACHVLPQHRSLVEFTARHASYADHPDFEEIVDGFEEAPVGASGQREPVAR